MPVPNNEVNTTITDGALGNVNVPSSRTMAIIGTSSAGTSQQILSTTSKAALISTFGYGQLTEAAALVIDAGGTVLAVKVPGPVAGASSAVTFAGTGSSVVTLSVGVAFDDYQLLFTVVKGGTIAATGITFTISLDGGRTTGPVISLGTAVTYAIAQTGLTLAFAAGTLVAGDTAKATTTAPGWLASDVTTAFTLLQNSGYQWGAGIHVCGGDAGVVAGTAGGKCIKANALTFEANMATLLTNFRYTFVWVDTNDATGGLAANEAAWMTAMIADYSSLSAYRVVAGAGFVNITSPITNLVAGAPQYRRPLTWSACKRAVAVNPWVHLGRVRDGALLSTAGPGTAATANDLYLYHDERVTPGLDGARFMAARTMVDKPGVFIKNPNIMAPPGSDFTAVYYRQVMDIACSISHQILENYINDTVRLNPLTGYILEQDARSIEQAGNTSLQANLVGIGACSAATLTVNRTDNINSTKILNAKVAILALGYILEIDLAIGFTNPAQAGA